MSKKTYENFYKLITPKNKITNDFQYLTEINVNTKITKYE